MIQYWFELRQTSGDLNFSTTFIFRIFTWCFQKMRLPNNQCANRTSYDHTIGRLLFEKAYAEICSSWKVIGKQAFASRIYKL